MMPITQADVLQYVQTNGPCVPNDIRQALKAQDNFVVGAILSELLGQGKIAITDMSLGTSKFYYDPQQPHVLEKIGHHLNEKDVRAFNLLKQERVVKNSELTPILRVSMAAIKDFSRILRVKTDTDEELYWYYYLLSAEEAFDIAKKKYLGEPEAPPAPPPVIPTPAQAPEPAQEHPKTLPKQRKPKAMQPVLQPTVQTTLLVEGFAKQVHDFFENKNIGVLQVISNKKTDIDCIVSVPSSVGHLHFYCKAKAKKSTSDGDLAAALLEAQQHKLPLLYVAGGTLSKKAHDLAVTQRVAVVTPWA